MKKVPLTQDELKALLGEHSDADANDQTYDEDKCAEFARALETPSKALIEKLKAADELQRASHPSRSREVVQRPVRQDHPGAFSADKPKVAADIVPINPAVEDQTFGLDGLQALNGIDGNVLAQLQSMIKVQQQQQALLAQMQQRVDAAEKDKAELEAAIRKANQSPSMHAVVEKDGYYQLPERMSDDERWRWQLDEGGLLGD